MELVLKNCMSSRSELLKLIGHADIAYPSLGSPNNVLLF